jgi:hypothetical protein
MFTSRCLITDNCSCENIQSCHITIHHSTLQLNLKAYSKTCHRYRWTRAIFSRLTSAITHNLRHCDFVQLHGFLGRTPFGSNVVLVATTLGLDWGCESVLAALLLDDWLTVCVLSILCCCCCCGWVCCCGCWLWFCNWNCKHTCNERTEQEVSILELLCWSTAFTLIYTSI